MVAWRLSFVHSSIVMSAHLHLFEQRRRHVDIHRDMTFAGIMALSSGLVASPFCHWARILYIPRHLLLLLCAAARTSTYAIACRHGGQVQNLVLFFSTLPIEF